MHQRLAHVLDAWIGEQRIRIVLDTDRSPATCAYFIEAISQGQLDSAVVFRVLAKSNQFDAEQSLINVVQLGATEGLDAPRTRIAHEDTNTTGLRHKQWAVSAARYAPGELYASFFVCMNDEPQLDYGGDRQPDGLGFAVFGHVVEGFELLESLHASAGAKDLLVQPRPIDRLFVRNVPTTEL